VLLGTLAASLGAVCFGFSMPMMKRTSRRIDPLAIAGPLHLFAIPWIVPLGLTNLPQAQFSTTAVLVVLVLGVFTSSLAFWMQLRILRHVTPVASMMPMFFVPLFGVAWGHLFLGEALGTGIYLGGALVLLAGLLVTGINPLRFLRPGRP
jgi:drug/metabolite transporter (DMT)-like permease